MKDGSEIRIITAEVLLITFNCDIIVNGFKESKITTEENKKILSYFNKEDVLDKIMKAHSTYQFLAIRQEDTCTLSNTTLNGILNKIKYSSKVKNVIFLITIDSNSLLNRSIETIIKIIAIHSIKNNIRLVHNSNVFIEGVNTFNKTNLVYFIKLRSSILNKLKLINNLTKLKNDNSSSIQAQEKTTL